MNANNYIGKSMALPKAQSIKRRRHLYCAVNILAGVQHKRQNVWHLSDRSEREYQMVRTLNSTLCTKYKYSEIQRTYLLIYKLKCWLFSRARV